MKNAEIEFVTFDAHDIISTSGDPVLFNWSGLYMYASQSTIANFNANYYDTTGIKFGNTVSATTTPSDIFKAFGYKSAKTGKNGNLAYGKVEGKDESVPYTADPYSQKKIYKTNSQSSAMFTYAATADDILAWLIANNYYVQ